MVGESTYYAKTVQIKIRVRKSKRTEQSACMRFEFIICRYG